MLWVFVHSFLLYFVSRSVDEEDAEAERMYFAVEEHIDSRRREQREKNEAKILQKLRKERPKIQQQFADFKMALKGLCWCVWRL